MTRLVTFFHDRSTGKGHVVRLPPEVRGAEDQAYVYSYERLPGPLRDLRDIPQIQDRLWGKKGGGGILVEIRDGRATIRASPQPGEGPSNFWLIRPGYPPQRRDLIPGQSLSLEPGARMLLPVDQTSEDRLESFLTDLEYLPQDLSLFITYAIGQPDLEERLRRLERRLEGFQGHGLQHRRSLGFRGWLEKTASWLRQPLPVGLFLAVWLLLGLGAAVPSQWFEDGPAETTNVENGERDTGPMPETTPGGAEAEEAAESPAPAASPEPEAPQDTAEGTSP